MDNLPVNVTDIAVAIALLVSAFLAYSRGFVREVLSVGGWIGAIFAVVKGWQYLSPYTRDLVPSFVSNIIDPEIAAEILAGIIIFIATLIILSLVTQAISKRVQDSALNALDQSLGFLFGLARAAVIICLLYLGIEWMAAPPEQPAWLRSARTMPVIETGAHWLKSLIPPETAANASETTTSVQNQARKIDEARKMMEGLVSPSPKGNDSGATEGYNEQIRKGMERLIDGTSQ